MKTFFWVLTSLLVVIGSSLILLDQQAKQAEEDATTAFILGAQYLAVTCLKNRYAVIPPTIKQQSNGAVPILLKCGDMAFKRLEPQSGEVKPNM